MKNLTELKGNWKEIAGKMKQKFAMLTDDDLLLAEGKQEELLGRLQAKLGKTKEEITFLQQIKDEISPDFFRNNRIDFDADKYLAKLGVTK